MALPVPLALCVGGVFCCSLLALHLLWLATLHRRPRPTVVSGEFAFAATLVGLTGFFVVGAAVAASVGPAVAAALPTGSLDAVWGRVVGEPQARTLSVAGYGLLLAVTTAVGFWRRRGTLEVFHIDPTAVPGAVEEAATAVGLGGTRVVGLSMRGAVGHATVAVRRLEPAVADELMAALTSRLADAPTHRSLATSGWLTAAACGLLGCTLACFLRFFLLTRMI